jgi:hypothetical protein
MRIGIVGGTDKNQPRYLQLARRSRCEVEFHDGYMSGTAGSALESLVHRCDVIVVVTRVNSHTAVRLARSHSQKLDRKLLIVRRFGLRQFEELARSEALGKDVAA